MLSGFQPLKELHNARRSVDDGKADNNKICRPPSKAWPTHPTPPSPSPFPIGQCFNLCSSTYYLKITYIYLSIYLNTCAISLPFSISIWYIKDTVENLWAPKNWIKKPHLEYIEKEEFIISFIIYMFPFICVQRKGLGYQKSLLLPSFSHSHLPTTYLPFVWGFETHLCSTLCMWWTCLKHCFFCNTVFFAGKKTTAFSSPSLQDFETLHAARLAALFWWSTIEDEPTLFIPTYS